MFSQPAKIALLSAYVLRQLPATPEVINQDSPRHARSVCVCVCE